jgi:hypothetical protein
VTASDSVAIASAFQPKAGALAPDMGARPYIDVACFWGPAADPARNGTKRLADLTPAMAQQQARFYPATNDAQAAVLIRRLMKGRELGRELELARANVFQTTGPIAPEVLAAMKALGIPVGP